jgi:hypothetical protein
MPSSLADIAATHFIDFTITTGMTVRMALVDLAGSGCAPEEPDATVIRFLDLAMTVFEMDFDGRSASSRRETSP